MYGFSPPLPSFNTKTSRYSSDVDDPQHSKLLIGDACTTYEVTAQLLYPSALSGFFFFSTAYKLLSFCPGHLHLVLFTFTGPRRPRRVRIK